MDKPGSEIINWLEGLGYEFGANSSKEEIVQKFSHSPVVRNVWRHIINHVVPVDQANKIKCHNLLLTLRSHHNASDTKFPANLKTRSELEDFVKFTSMKKKYECLKNELRDAKLNVINGKRDLENLKDEVEVLRNATKSSIRCQVLLENKCDEIKKEINLMTENNEAASYFTEQKNIKPKINNSLANEEIKKCLKAVEVFNHSRMLSSERPELWEKESIANSVEALMFKVPVTLILSSLIKNIRDIHSKFSDQTCSQSHKMLDNTFMHCQKLHVMRAAEAEKGRNILEEQTKVVTELYSKVNEKLLKFMNNDSNSSQQEIDYQSDTIKSWLEHNISQIQLREGNQCFKNLIYMMELNTKYPNQMEEQNYLETMADLDNKMIEMMECLKGLFRLNHSEFVSVISSVKEQVQKLQITFGPTTFVKLKLSLSEELDTFLSFYKSLSSSENLRSITNGETLNENIPDSIVLKVLEGIEEQSSLKIALSILNSIFFPKFELVSIDHIKTLEKNQSKILSDKVEDFEKYLAASEDLLGIVKSALQFWMKQPFNHCLSGRDYDSLDFKEWMKRLDNAIGTYNSAHKLKHNIEHCL